ncbi:MAG: hypothetical protein CMC48_08080 [Flavobacteriaceae bacterium]|nr:hypothetical protein [Flavobacteriaceae bacterium]|tara:strand:+ start:178 stop:633 length:456 start_codon:yes stop_codon:yes gene_type:complete
MSIDKNIRFLLEKLLNSYRETKLSYLNSADSHYHPSFNRFFNHQAIIRNNMFFTVSNILSEIGIEVGDVILKRPDIKQFMSTKIEREKKDLFFKNLKKDIELKEILLKLIKIDSEKNRTDTYKKHLKKISESIKANKSYSLGVKEKMFLNN